MQFLNSFIRTSYVLESDARHLFGHQRGPRFTKLHDARAATLHAAHQEPENEPDQDEGENETKER